MSILQAAEAHMSLGNVSYSHSNEQYFQQAIRFLQTASRVMGFQLSPYLQRCARSLSPIRQNVLIVHPSYLDDFGRLVP